MPDSNHNLPSSKPPLHTIDDVLKALDDIIDLSIRENNPGGIFAYVYRRTTAQIREGIREGRFEDNARMEQFDVAFAGKYIEAYWTFREGGTVAEVWEQAFNATQSGKIIMQHILLGMNAHINYDLGVSAAEFTDGQEIQHLKNDFMLINRLLAELVDEMQQRIGRVSPLMFLLDWLAKDEDEAIVNFSMEKARKAAWNFAVRLSQVSHIEQENIKSVVDDSMTRLAMLVADPPGWILPAVLRVIRFFEEKEIGKIIIKLRSG